MSIWQKLFRSKNATPVAHLATPKAQAVPKTVATESEAKQQPEAFKVASRSVQGRVINGSDDDYAIASPLMELAMKQQMAVGPNKPTPGFSVLVDLNGQVHSVVPLGTGGGSELVEIRFDSTAFERGPDEPLRRLRQAKGRNIGVEFLSKLTVEEKRAALDFDEFYLQSILDARQGRAHVVEVGLDNKFVEKMSDEDIRQAIELTRLQKRAIAASEAGIPREAIRYFEQICAKAPFDSISLMSMGVQYAYLRDGRKAVECLERALSSDPGNQRIRNNLQAIREDFRL